MTKMLYSALLAASFSVLVSATAIPTADSFGQGLAKRSFLDDIFGGDKTPGECSFNARQEFSYQQFKESKGTACIGWQSQSCDPWKKNEVDDIIKAVKEQVTKDGFTKSTTVGKWTANWLDLTTAFSNRDTGEFESKIREYTDKKKGDEAKALTYFWSKDGDFLEVVRSSCP